jgi:hypothetical protein
VRRTLAYAATTWDEAQRSIRTFYEVVKLWLAPMQRNLNIWTLLHGRHYRIDTQVYSVYAPVVKKRLLDKSE